jgi:hypothetical protein
MAWSEVKRVDSWANGSMWLSVLVSHISRESRMKDCLDYALARAAAWWTETRVPGGLQSVLEERRCEW